MFSDFTCTALQLANFWQDVTVDLKKDRIYLPMRAAGQARLHRRAITRTIQRSFRRLMREAVDVAHDLIQRGLPLVKQVDRRLVAGP